ncbi:MAG: hypothetical protein N3B21_16040 [Clostridia bacterium]|nr:hypothetical protein [Clostridia bacterium]
MRTGKRSKAPISHCRPCICLDCKHKYTLTKEFDGCGDKCFACAVSGFKNKMSECKMHKSINDTSRTIVKIIVVKQKPKFKKNSDYKPKRR